MAKHFSNFKKYETSFSYRGYHFWAKNGRVATRCPHCDMIAEAEDVTQVIESINQHEQEIQDNEVQ